MQDHGLSEVRKTIYVPKANTEAGACLTAANWSEVGVNILAWELDSLIVKPGLELLRRLEHFKTYYGWEGEVVFDAQKLIADKSGNYLIRSPFDGAKIHISFSDLYALIIHLKPDYLIPSYDFQRHLQAEAKVLPQTIQLLMNDETLMVSDKPAADALAGIVYTHSDAIDLTKTCYAEDFNVIDAHCACPSCRQGLTRAYLHHLFVQTPLLCQRFLIQHNAHYFQKKGNDENNPDEIRS